MRAVTGMDHFLITAALLFCDSGFCRSSLRFYAVDACILRGFSQMTKKSPALRVLVVEDELLIRWAITETLTDAGHTVIEAQDAATAVQALADSAEPVDAVILDYCLPDSNDLALLATIRKLSPHSPVIFMTAYSTPEVTQRALDLAVYRVVNKPFEMPVLEELLLQAHASALG
jgi:DNA-binding NtrC family response regulator